MNLGTHSRLSIANDFFAYIDKGTAKFDSRRIHLSAHLLRESNTNKNNPQFRRASGNKIDLFDSLRSGVLPERSLNETKEKLQSEKAFVISQMVTKEWERWPENLLSFWVLFGVISIQCWKTLIWLVVLSKAGRSERKLFRHELRVFIKATDTVLIIRKGKIFTGKRINWFGSSFEALFKFYQQ